VCSTNFEFVVQGLIPSIKQVCPQSEHRKCVRHLYANFRNHDHRGMLLKDLLW
jgi:transposase-like protein